MRNQLSILSAIGILLLLSACAGLKETEDRQPYYFMDNLTSRFNIIHHSRELIAGAESENRDQHQENYRHLLPIFIQPTETSIVPHTVLMDSVIKKANRVINEKDRGRYIDEAYFLIGKANYLKGNYYNAVEFFDYTSGNSQNDRRIRQESMVWHARALMQLETYHSIESLLDTIFAEEELSKRTRRHALATLAQFHLHQNQYTAAITALEHALNYRGKRAENRRWHFLLAQLYENNEQYQHAITHYKKAAKGNADYAMRFEADLKQIALENQIYQNRNQQLKRLHSLLKDDKNRSFRDRILYVIGETLYQQGNEDEALAYFNRSVQASESNAYQKATSYMRLGDHYFEQSFFTEAIHYYDSAALFLPMDQPETASDQHWLSNMTEILPHFLQMARQDTLQWLVTLPEAQRAHWLDSVVTDRYAEQLTIEKERKKRQRSAQREQEYAVTHSPFDQLGSDDQRQTYTDNRFYFNNPDAIGLGISTFRRIWGQRDAVDNWRYSAQQRLAMDEPVQAQPDLISSVDAFEETGSREMVDSLQFAQQIRRYYEEHLPLDPATWEQSRASVKKALQSIGEIYRFGLKNNESAHWAYTELLEQFPDAPEYPAWLYSLYILHSDQNPRLAASFKTQLIQNYNTSEFAQILENPHYLEEQAEHKRQFDLAYQNVFEQYLEENFKGVMHQSDSIIRTMKTLENGSGIAQLSYLNALAIGRTSSVEHFSSALTELVGRFPDDELITPLVQQHLNYLEAHAVQFEGRDVALAGREEFVMEPRLTRWPQLVIRNDYVPPQDEPRSETEAVDAAPVIKQQAAESETVSTGTGRDLNVFPEDVPYYFVINVMHPTVNLAPSRFGIGQFNRSQYAGSEINHQTKRLEGEAQLVYIGMFASYREAKAYEQRLLPLLGDIMKIPSDVYNTFVITESIFGTLSDFEQVEEYVSFYQREAF